MDEEFDYDLAYDLQIKEAISASLALQQSQSLNSDDDNLQTLEFEKSETGFIIKAETKKQQADLHRQIHDRNVAREIHHMPVDQWLDSGSNFERPYGEGTSSSSKIEFDKEVFRVYFKGLMRKETVSSRKTVTLAGIGVAICDSRDELIFQLRKPLDLSEDSSKSKQNTEWKALIEALKAAIALDLKRIKLYCDYYTLFQHASGRWKSKQPKVKTFMNEVILLRESFTDSTLSYVTHNDIKFAPKFASEAIVSQLNKLLEQNQDKVENCVICLDDKPTHEFFSIEKCKHRYCFSCMKQHGEVKLLNGTVPKCPHEGCESELKIERCVMFLTPKFIEMMKQMLKEASIPVTDKVYCPYPKCSALMSRKELLRKSRYVPHENGARTCLKCYGEFCINCKVPWHKSMKCWEYKRRNPTPLVEESKLKNLAAANMWRQCVKCKHMIELDTGCFHMTCRCGYEFCYTCGAEWKNKKATCSCPLWHENNIMDTDDDDDDDEIMFHEEDDDGYSSDDGYF